MRKFGDKRILGMYLVCFILLGIGFTYALVSDSLALNTTTAMIGIDEAAYGSTTFDSENLDFKPILDSTVGTTESEDNVIKIDFTVGGAETNNADKPIIYDIALNDLELNCALLSPYIKWRLLKNDTQIAEGSLDYKQGYVIEDNRLVLTTVQQDLPGYDVSGGSYDNYTFYMWFSDSCQSDLATCKANSQLVDQSAMLGQNLSGRVEVELYTGSKKELIRNPSTSIEEGVVCFSQYQVEFETNGGTLSNDQSSMTVISNQTYGELPTPTRENASVSYDANGGTLDSGVTNPGTINWTFDGWYKESTFITAVTSETTVTDTQNHVLYAKWSSSNTITLPSASRDGYIFDGWYTLASGGVRVGGSGSTYNGDGEVTLYAHWIEDTETVKVYTVTYHNGENTLDTSSHVYDINSSLALWSNLGGSITNSDAGWSFAGWSTDDTGTVITYNDGQGIINLTSENGGNVDLYAIYKRDITFVHGASGGMISSLEQFWNPLGTTGAYVSGVEVPQLTAITNWTALGFRDDMSASDKEYDVGSIISPGVSSDVTTFYGTYTRTLTFYSGINKTKSDGTRTQYLNANTNNTVSSVTSYTPTDISVDDYITDDSYTLEEHNDTGWVSLGYRIDTTNGTNQFDSTTSIVVDYSTGNDLYAVYSRSYTAKFYSGVNKATTETGISDMAYYNTATVSLPTTVTITLLGKDKSTNITNWSELGWRDDVEASPNGREYAYEASGITVPFGTDFYGNYSRMLSLTYDGNGATSGSVSSSSNFKVYLNSASTLTSRNIVGAAASNGFTRTGYTFKGWAIGSVDSSETVTPGNSFYLPSLEYNASPFTATLYAIWQDNTAPTAAISSTSTFKSSTQTATLTCGDNVGVVSYYWGTSSPTSSSTYTTLDTVTTNMSITKSVSLTGTYYLACKDSVGNVSSVVNKTYRSYTVYNMLLKTTGTKGTYNTTNYDQKSVNSTPFIIPSGTSLTLSSIRTLPTGSSSSAFKGYNNAAPSTTSVTLLKTAPTITADSIYTMWFDRTEYTISYNANGCSNVSNMPSSQTKRYGVNLTLADNVPTCENENKFFKGWSTSSSSTTATYQPGGTYSSNANRTYYAVWAADGKVECSKSGANYYYLNFSAASADAIASDENFSTCTLLNDLDEESASIAFPRSSSFTIDLDEFTLIGSLENSSAGPMILKASEKGTIQAKANDDTSSSQFPVINSEGGILIIESGTYKSSTEHAVIVNYGDLNITGGNFENDCQSDDCSTNGTYGVVSSGSLNMSGGEFTVTVLNGAGMHISGSATLTGGKITSNTEAVVNAGGNIVLDGVSISSTGSDDSVFLNHDSGSITKIYGNTSINGTKGIRSNNGDVIMFGSNYSVSGTISVSETANVYKLWESSTDSDVVGVGIINKTMTSCKSWTYDDNQSDLVLYDVSTMSTTAGDTVYYCRFDRTNHDSNTGPYITDFYNDKTFVGRVEWSWGFPK